MVVLKKTQYVELHELGVADTLLQIGITWCLSIFMFYVADFLKRTNFLKKVILLIGNISYELYLAHVLFLDWLKQQTMIRNFMIYGIAVLISTVILYGINCFVQWVEKSVER